MRTSRQQAISHISLSYTRKVLAHRTTAAAILDLTAGFLKIARQAFWLASSCESEDQQPPQLKIILSIHGGLRSIVFR
jgi:hypothetical protein